MLKGRLGLESARVPQGDRHGLLWLGKGRLMVQDGVLHFLTTGDGDLEAGDYTIPFQNLSCIVMQPGTSVTHDALRILASHGTGLLAVGGAGIRMYASMPFGPDASERARSQARHWADPDARSLVARRMYGWRLGEVLPSADISVLRGIEGARMKETYRRVAEQFGISWRGRRYDRQEPDAADYANQAINHAASATEGAAMLATSVTGTIPQLGFIHEDSGISFCLDIADLFRDEITLPVAFGAVREHAKAPAADPLERVVRRVAARTFYREKVVVRMIDRIKELFDVDDGRGNA
ncbi:MAG: type I-E CRISPR-associated endonuclease Cas1e [Thermoanaerobaculia bacterium]|nr:type I-E CRISPR-associated endonuclease Cas1e [Thermoanaerobaculia bacterium]